MSNLSLKACLGIRPLCRRLFRAGAHPLCLATILTTLSGATTQKAPEPKPAEPKKSEAAPAASPAAPPAAPTAIPKTRKNNLAPLPSTEKAVAVHAPFEAGDCALCHKNADPKNPGPTKEAANQLCLGCHENLKDILARKSVHVAARESCVSCHNPHNSKQPKLLVEETQALCLSCHGSIRDLVLKAPVKHDALNQGAKCANCHNPHGSNVEHLLVQLPMPLCLKCHGTDDVADHNGKKLTNMKKLLADNPKHHGPVAAEDCSACHNPHGAEYFRLLKIEYPPKFYSPWDPKLYALCFSCHEESAFTTPVTDTLTQFRDGTKNLHFVHVNKTELGRTCRACHEVHASKQDHQIRDSVPFGSQGWLLKLNYTRTPTGGSCEKTCHSKRSYNNSTNPSAPTK